MFQIFVAVPARDDAHAAVFAIAVIDGEPGRHFDRRLESPILKVLVPRHKFIIGTVFAKEL